MAKQQKQATWGGRFKEGPSALMATFSESVSFDSRLALYDIEGSRAHAKMLKEVGLLKAGELKEILRGLKQVESAITKGEFDWKPELEDVHMNIELALTALAPAAAKLHTGRSRNDQVATDMRLFFKRACASLTNALIDVQSALVELAQTGQDMKCVIPGYTHLQRAQPVPIAHHLLAYVEMLERDKSRFQAIADQANVCPLGAGALGGSTLPLNRERVAELLGFVDSRGRPRVTRNSMDTVADRDLYLGFTGASSMLALHLSRFAEDLILWCSREFEFITLPDTFTTGSSLMPQKKNPDALELIRGKSGRVIGNHHALEVMVKGLPLTYNRDLQEDKPPVFDSCDQLELCLAVLSEMIPGIGINAVACAKAVGDPHLLATDLADWLVMEGVPFREAHHVVGTLVGLAEDQGCFIPDLEDAAVAAVHPAMINPDWRKVFEVTRAMAERQGTGMAGFRPVKKELNHWRRSLGM